MNEKLRSYCIVVCLMLIIGLPVLWIAKFFFRFSSHSSILKPNVCVRVRHLGVIMDGNRRWSRARNYSNEYGYREGAERLYEIIQVCLEEGVLDLTVYALSFDNVKKRDQKELNTLFDIGIGMLEEKASWFIDNGVKVHFVGNKDVFPEKVLEKIAHLENLTQAGKILRLNVLFGYDPFEDILVAVKDLTQKVSEGSLQSENITANSLFDSMGSKGIPPIDILIRTGGCDRLSGFLPLQTVYSELVF